MSRQGVRRTAPPGPVPRPEPGTGGLHQHLEKPPAAGPQLPVLAAQRAAPDHAERVQDLHHLDLQVCLLSLSR